MFSETHVEWAMAFPNGQLVSMVITGTDSQKVFDWARQWSSDCHLLRREVTYGAWTPVELDGPT